MDGNTKGGGGVLTRVTVMGRFRLTKEGVNTLPEYSKVFYLHFQIRIVKKLEHVR